MTDLKAVVKALLRTKELWKLLVILLATVGLTDAAGALDKAVDPLVKLMGVLLG